jgi:hypothetical protein
MPNTKDFLFDRKRETASFSRTPLGVINIFLAILRERFSLDFSGQTTGFNWAPTPDLNSSSDYKATELYIERWGNVNTKVANFAPAITIKRAAQQFQSLSFSDMAFKKLQNGATLNIGQMNTGLQIACFSRSEPECEILSNMVHELFIRCRWVIQKKFELQVCQPTMHSEVQIYEETQKLDNKIYQSNISLNLIFDYNHALIPLAPLLSEISISIAASATDDEVLLHEILDYTPIQA